MDLDFDFADDKIIDFLKSNLKEIQSTNQRMEKQLKERQKFLNNVRNGSSMSVDESGVLINFKWKKIWNNKYVIGFEVTNNEVYPLEQLNIILKWDSDETLDYEVQTFEILQPDIQLSLIPTFLSDHPASECGNLSDTLKKSTKIIKDGLIIVTMEVPTFISKTVIHLDGILLYDQKFGNDDGLIKVAKLELQIEDCQKSECLISFNTDLIDLLALSSMSHFNLTMVLPQNWSSSMDSTFEIHCSFEKLSIASRCRKYFIPKKITEQINDTLIVVHAPSSKSLTAYPLIVYTKNTTALIHLIHYLHKSISDLLIMPNVYYNRYSYKENIDEDFTRSELTSNLSDEVQFVLDFMDKAKLDPDFLSEEEVKKFRISLAKLENKSDVEYMKLSTCLD